MSEYVPVRVDCDSIPMVVASGQSVTGGQLVMVTSASTIQPTSGASVGFLGVAGYDGAAGDLVTVYCEGEHESTASGTVTAGNLLEPAAAGAIAAHTLGTNDANSVGVALTSATNGNKVRWRRA
jgi:hypothetical protein